MSRKYSNIIGENNLLRLEVVFIPVKVVEALHARVVDGPKKKVWVVDGYNRRAFEKEIQPDISKVEKEVIWTTRAQVVCRSLETGRFVSIHEWPESDDEVVADDQTWFHPSHMHTDCYEDSDVEIDRVWGLRKEAYEACIEADIECEGWDWNPKDDKETSLKEYDEEMEWLEAHTSRPVGYYYDDTVEIEEVVEELKEFLPTPPLKAHMSLSKKEARECGPFVHLGHKAKTQDHRLGFVKMLDPAMVEKIKADYDRKMAKRLQKGK